MLVFFLFVLYIQNALSAPPPSGQPPTDPRLTEIGTPCSNDTTKAWLDIIFVIDSSQFMTAQKMKSLSKGLSSVFTKFTISQNGNHTTRVGIITFASDVIIHSNLTAFLTNTQLLQALNNLPSYVNSNDAEARIITALRTAYDLVPKEKNNHIPLIVLIGANYDHNNIDGLENVAKSIKESGIEIMTISFASAESPLTKIFQKISSYSYISTQKGLYESVLYAFTQINCVCPLQSIQFNVYNQIWLNYTKYADCFYGYLGETLPEISNLLCDPGILVSINSNIKQNFIIDQIVPYVLRGHQNFTIGLHKSPTDGIWKWWGYNGTEYPASLQSLNPKPDDKFGYLMNYKRFNWEIETTDGNEPMSYVCQVQACDAGYICDLTSN